MIEGPYDQAVDATIKHAQERANEGNPPKQLWRGLGFIVAMLRHTGETITEEEARERFKHCLTLNGCYHITVDPDAPVLELP